MQQPSRPAIIQMALGAFAVLILFRSAHLQLWKGGDLASRAVRQYYSVDTVPTARGDFLDSDGRPLVQSIEYLSIAVAPKELHAARTKNGRRDRALLEKTLTNIRVDAATRRKALNSGAATNWVQIPGRFLPSELAAVRSVRGVYVEPIIQRASLASAGARAFLGRVDQTGMADGGLEKVFDSVLRGEPGLVRLMKSPSGARDRAVPVQVLKRGTAGNSIILSINREWQGVAEWALSSAVEEQNASSGDIVIVNPKTGEILAMSSYGQAEGFASTAMIASPFEPGSTVKPLLVSRLLELQRARPDDVVETGNELWIPGRKNPIHDTHAEPSFSLRGVVKHSSNIGMVKFAQRLSMREHYEALRDFGVGIQTGVSLPGEAAGRMENPARWDSVVQSSAAIGYGMSMTSLQLAMAFASIANGGELLEPTLVKEIRKPDGQLVFRHSPRVVRRTMSPQVAAQVRMLLRDVVREGTAKTAEIAEGELAGKTGTSRYAGPDGYVDEKFIATFAGMYPAASPEFVIVVRLVDPESDYGGLTAAPVSAAVLKAAAAATSAAIDKRAVARAPQALASGAKIGSATNSREEKATVDEEWPDDDNRAAPPRVIDLRAAEKTAAQTLAVRAVPRVNGLPLREAVFILHRAGFRVRLERNLTGMSGASARAADTSPPSGTERKPGDIVLLYISQ